MIFVHGNEGADFVPKSERSELMAQSEKIAKQYNLIPEKAYDILYSEYVLRKYTHGSGKLKVNRKVSSWCGCVSIVGHDIIFDVPAVFKSVVDKSSNFDAFATFKGIVRMDFTFYGISKNGQKRI